MVAAGRALASKDPRGLINDPYAEPLVEAVGLDFFTKQIKGELDLGAVDEQSPTFLRLIVDAIMLRTRHFDEFFLDAAEDGIRQVVILAAGLDARAYRLPWPSGTVVYEVDQPQVIEFKSATLADIGTTPTADRRAIGVDLRDDWPASLRAAGFDTETPTAWCAEGLLQYLPPDAQERLLDNITGLSAAGSVIAADYDHWIGGVAAGSVTEISRTWRAQGFNLDMPTLRFTGERKDAAESLAARGWRTVSMRVEELFNRYGIERVRIGERDVLDTVVYVNGTLATR